MKKEHWIPIILSVIIIVVVAINLVDFPEDEVDFGKLYNFSISVGEKTYMILVVSNCSSKPEVSYFGIGKSVLVDFRDNQENVFCNITIPADLIWGELSVINKYYEMSDAEYYRISTVSNHFFHFIFNQTGLVEHFEIRGTEGVIP